MKTSFALLIAFGVCYLYILEDIGNFISFNLEKYKRSLQSQDSDIDPDDFNELKILRTPADLLIETQAANFTEEEMNILKKVVVQFEELVNDTKFPRINHEELYYNNFYRKVIFDILARRELPPK